MPIHISYWSGVDTETRLCYGRLIASETISISGTSAQSGAVPAGAALARCSATETCRISNASASPTASATGGVYLEGGQSIDLDVNPGDRIAGITA